MTKLRGEKSFKIGNLEIEISIENRKELEEVLEEKLDDFEKIKDKIMDSDNIEEIERKLEELLNYKVDIKKKE